MLNDLRPSSRNDMGSCSILGVGGVRGDRDGRDGRDGSISSVLSSNLSSSPIPSTSRMEPVQQVPLVSAANSNFNGPYY